MRLDSVTLRDAWAEWVQQETWDWFATLTFRDAIHPEAASKRFRYWWHRLNWALDGRRWRERSLGVGYCLAWEYQRRGVLHGHVLLTDARLYRLSRAAWAKEWVGISGLALIRPVDPNEQSLVSAYTTKYVVYGADVEVGGEALRGVSSSQLVLAV